MGKKQATRCYINACSAIVPVGTANSSILYVDEPDYKSIITDANLRRRMSRTVKMGVAAGLYCLQLLPDDYAIDAIVTATGLGCLADTEKFLNLMHTAPDRNLLNPTPFIQSTFNTVGAQIALITGNRAYNTTCSNLGMSFENALTDAMLLLDGEAQHILLGSIDEASESLYQILKRLGMLSGISLGEGAVFFALTNSPEEKPIAQITDMDCLCGEMIPRDVADEMQNFLENSGTHPGNVDLLLTGENGNPSDSAFYNSVCSRLFPNTRCEGFKHLCGEYPTAVSFGLMHAVSLLKEGQTALVYNSYYNQNHTFILVKKCS